MPAIPGAWAFTAVHPGTGRLTLSRSACGPYQPCVATPIPADPAAPAAPPALGRVVSVTIRVV